MSASKLKTRLSRTAGPALNDLGFQQVTPYAFERCLDGLAQGIGFVNGSSSRAGTFTADIYWTFRNCAIKPSGAMDFRRRIGEFSTGRDEWYPIEDDQVSRAVAIFETQALPFLDDHDSIAKIISRYESGDTDALKFFGIDEGWRSFNIGHCYLHMKNLDVAKTYLQKVIDEDSAWPYDWVQKRKQAVLTTLEDLDRRTQGQGD